MVRPIIAPNMDGLLQDCHNLIINSLELLQSCTKPSIWIMASSQVTVMLRMGSWYRAQQPSMALVSQSYINRHRLSCEHYILKTAELQWQQLCHVGRHCGCYDNPWCHQWWQCWCHDDSWFSALTLTRTTRTPAFWGYPPPPHDYPYHWVILDPKSKEDKVKVTNLKNSPKVQIF